jgi:hypothetical protein
VTTLNFTGRQRITRDRVRLRVLQSGSVLTLDVERLDLDSLRLPNDAQVIVEAYRQTARHRISCGTVGDLSLPTSVTLPEFNVPEGLLFRVKVVGVSEADGKLLASGDRIPASGEDDDGNQVPILPFRQSQDLNHQLWRLDIEDEPIVLINSEVGDWKGFALEPRFQALVFPEIVRQIALWALLNKDDAEDKDSATSVWRRFLSNLGYDPVAGPTDDAEQQKYWADEVAEYFASKYKFL